MRKAAGGNFSKLPVEDPETGDVLAVIETPRGSRNKYAFDLDLGTFRLKAELPEGNVFPFDFGFIPSTKADDGDPLDLLVLLEDSVPMGCAISVRLIGAIETEQKEKGEAWVRNDRLVGVATQAHVHAHVISGCLGFLIDRRLGNFRQCFVRCFLFFKGFLQKGDRPTPRPTCAEFRNVRFHSARQPVRRPAGRRREQVNLCIHA